MFLNKRDYEQALLSLFYYRVLKPPIKFSRFKDGPWEWRRQVYAQMSADRNGHAEVVSFVFMPNHFHLLLKQTAGRGIGTFMSKFANSYTKYFNTKHKRPGPVFQGVFKAVHVESEEQLVHLSRYIHLNPLVSGVVAESDFFNYSWSSFREYVSGQSERLLMDPVLDLFPSPEDYKKFVLDRANYGKQLEEIKHLTFE